MAKIRGFKPDLWTDDDFTEVSPLARLLWLGMWNFACDNGHLQDKSKQIKGRVLPNDEVNCADLLRELDHQGLIERSDGWITVPNLTHHQRPHKRWWVTCEKPGCALPDGASYGYSKRKSTVEQRLNNGGPTVDHGCSTDDVDVDGDVDGELMVKVKVRETSLRASALSATETPDRFQEFWDTYGHKVKRSDAEKKWRTALKKPGVTPDLLIAAAAAYVAWERANNEGGRYIAHPSTWLHGERWADERVARTPPQTRVQSHMALVQQLAERDQTPQIGEQR